MLYLIVNPMARRGLGLADLKRAEEYFDREGTEYVERVSEYHKHAIALAYEAVVEKADVVVACGGDGTLHEVLNGFMYAKTEMLKAGEACNTKLAVLPCGTGNDFMRSANMTIDVVKAAEVVARGDYGSVDVIEIDGVYEITFACRGIDVDVVNSVNKSKKKTERSYLKNIIKCLIRRIKYDFEIIADGERFKFNGLFAAVLNGGKLAGGINFSPDAKIDDGFMDLVTVKYRSVIKNFLTLLKIMKRGAVNDGYVTVKKCKNVEIINNQKQIDVDGELFSDLAFKAKIVPSAIDLIK